MTGRWGSIGDRLGRFILMVENCWEWTGHRNKFGYGTFRVSQKRCTLAHRAMWELKHGPVPDGYAVDHLCRNRGCVNPDHLEMVTVAENVHRSARMGISATECPHGHPYNWWNTYVNKRGHRTCRTCTRERMRRLRKARGNAK